MDGTSFERGGGGEVREWGQPWPSAPGRPRLTHEQLHLVESVRKRLCTMARAVARRGAVTDVEDLQQLAMEHALLLVPEYRPERGATFFTFIYWRVRGALKASLRAELLDRGCMAGAEGSGHCSATTRLALAATEVLACYEQPASAEERLIAAEELALRCRAIERGLARLDGTATALVRACFWEGKSGAEAARELGLEYENARYRLRLALRFVGKSLERTGQAIAREARVVSARRPL